jgi:AcrR family transcriptional regulator
MQFMAVERWTPERRRNLTRTALIDAAAEVFARRGFHGAALEEIAETAGFTRGAIYTNFADKEDLFFAVIDRFNDGALSGFADLMKEQDGASGLDMGVLAEQWLDLVGADEHLLLLQLEWRLYALRNPDVKERLAAHRRRTVEAIAAFIEREAANVGFTLPFAADQFASVMLSASDGFVQANHLGQGDSDLFKTFLDMLMTASLGPATPQPAAQTAARPSRRVSSRP